MYFNQIYQRKKLVLTFFGATLLLIVLLGRLAYLMVFCSTYYGEKAEDLHQRERSIKAARGKILDRNGIVLADNTTVCTVSVIYNQIKEPEAVISMLCKELGLEEETVRKKVEKVSSIERVKANVSKEVGDAILAYGYEGVKVDEDSIRYYPYGNLASKVLGFAGGDNQGIIGLEVEYEELLRGKDGVILTLTDARGVELKDAGDTRLDPTPGQDLYTTIDYSIQKYAQQVAEKIMLQKEAQEVNIIVMNPQNGEIYAMVSVPEFDLNDPFANGNSMEEWNEIWRNSCVSDTYEPGSIFKVITTAAALEEDVVTLEDGFYCPGYKVVEDRRIRCHENDGHGSETFVEGIQNSCNPVFIELGMRLGVENFYKYFNQFKLLEKTGIDLPGEATTIMHKKENVGLVELATISFGQSFQITPIQLATTISSIINGGHRVTPHFAQKSVDNEGEETFFEYPVVDGIVDIQTTETIRGLLESVVSEGTGNKAYIEGYQIGGKTATSQTLPRSENRYIASFIGFEPASDPTVLAMITISDPSGVYYGGTIAAPAIREVFENILPYLRKE